VGQSSSEANDRAEEHWAAFESFKALQHGTSLGEVVEVSLELEYSHTWNVLIEYWLLSRLERARGRNSRGFCIFVAI